VLVNKDEDTTVLHTPIDLWILHNTPTLCITWNIHSSYWHNQWLWMYDEWTFWQL